MFGKLMSAGKQALAAQAGAPPTGANTASGAAKQEKGKQANLFNNLLQSGEIKNVLVNLTPQNQQVVASEAHSQLPTEAPASSCTGNKKSLFVGINYYGTKNELRGCIEDVKNIKQFMVENFHFPTDPAHMLTLTDDVKDPALIPTLANILKGIEWLVAGAKDGDSLFFHYSGHGGQQPDTDGDELDGMDEAIIPVDFETAGFLVDDLLHDKLVRQLPKGVRCTVITDCCHSGSILDLPFQYNIDGSLAVTETDNRKAAIDAAMKAGHALFAGDKKAAMQKGMEAAKLFMAKPAPAGASEKQQAIMQIKTTVCDCIHFSGCKDNQTSADAFIGQKPSGAMSWAFAESFRSKGFNMTYTELLGEMRRHLEGKYQQIPQMSAGRRLNLNVKYTM